MKCTLRIALCLALIAALLPKTYEVRPGPEKPAPARPIAAAIVLRPELVPVCACESSYEGHSWAMPRQFELDGKVRLGRQNPNDIGMCQINWTAHSSTIRGLGLDIWVATGNMAFANYLFERDGFTPWTWSYDPVRKRCQWE